MATVTLTQGRVALIDDEDLTLVSRHKWHYSKGSKHYGRAATNNDSSPGLIYMHRLILSAPKGVEVDHIDGNPLNNRRANLRLVSRAQNAKNQGRSRANKSGHKGVSWHSRAGKWQVHIMAEGSRKYLGLFVDLDAAAAAYDRAALQYFGEFRRLNKS